MGKVIEISPIQAKRLHHLALAEGTSEDALIGAALELLFRQKERDEALADDLVALQSLSTESGTAGITDVQSHRDPRDFSVTYVIPIPLPDSGEE